MNHETFQLNMNERICIVKHFQKKYSNMEKKIKDKKTLDFCSHKSSNLVRIENENKKQKTYDRFYDQLKICSFI